jgi:hypothetical protein
MAGFLFKLETVEGMPKPSGRIAATTVTDRLMAAEQRPTCR